MKKGTFNFAICISLITLIIAIVGATYAFFTFTYDEELKVVENKKIITGLNIKGELLLDIEADMLEEDWTFVQEIKINVPDGTPKDAEGEYSISMKAGSAILDNLISYEVYKTTGDKIISVTHENHEESEDEGSLPNSDDTTTTEPVSPNETPNIKEPVGIPEMKTPMMERQNLTNNKYNNILQTVSNKYDIDYGGFTEKSGDEFLIVGNLKSDDSISLEKNIKFKGNMKETTYFIVYKINNSLINSKTAFSNQVVIEMITEEK